MIEEFIAWSEVWATLLPILIWCYKRPVDSILDPIKIYLVLALNNYFICDSAYKYILFLNNNRFLYNIISIERLFLFMWFFALNGIPSSNKLRSIFFVIVCIVLILNFTQVHFSENFSSTFTLEGIILIAYCIIYFFKKIRSEEVTTKFDPSLIIITGLAIYEAISFPIFISYDTLTEKTKDFAVSIWDVHNIAYIVLCIFIARAFYGRIK